MQTVSLSFHRFDAWSARLWVLGQMGAARLSLPRVPGIGFWKLCGSGLGEGFTPIPNTAVWAILATWPDEATAREQTARAPVFERWRNKSSETWTVFLSTTSVRGAWSGANPFDVAQSDVDPDAGSETVSQTGADTKPAPIAALTRATVKPSVAMKFWRRVPNISRTIGADPNVAFKIGIGEVPWMQQVTFSIWPDVRAMADFARSPNGPHAQAIQAVRDGAWFREELYARFRILGDSGQWEGKSPLANLGVF
ncbi:MAG: spheroidene monooxygenase [Paracoccaceae bacterium]